MKTQREAAGTQREATGNDLKTISSDEQSSLKQGSGFRTTKQGKGTSEHPRHPARHGGARKQLPQPSHGSNIVPRAHAASLARTHERNEYDFPVGLTPPTSDPQQLITNNNTHTLIGSNNTLCRQQNATYT